MYLMYVDESGDVGLAGSPTQHFVLTGIVMHELRWSGYLDQLVDFRKRMLKTFGLHMREEIHASEFINRPRSVSRIAKSNRLTILRNFADELGTMTDFNVINVIVNKNGKPMNYDVFDMAWRTLLQRFENTISHRNFRGPTNADDKGMIIADNTDVNKLTKLIRQMRRYNPIPHNPVHGMGYRNLMLKYIIEDPNFRDSEDSYFIQAADLAAYLLYQYYWPNTYMRKKSGKNYFLKLNPILCKVASSADPLGIVWL
ncbi:MAG: DUF3800 domain-containing protein [Chloroflexi bacterium]|nr:MAG: DUF3800 domain-containing protein [Chloroflexota bacterium]